MNGFSVSPLFSVCSALSAAFRAKSQCLGACTLLTHTQLGGRILHLLLFNCTYYVRLTREFSTASAPPFCGPAGHTEAARAYRRYGLQFLLSPLSVHQSAPLVHQPRSAIMIPFGTCISFARNALRWRYAAFEQVSSSLNYRAA